VITRIPKEIAGIDIVIDPGLRGRYLFSVCPFCRGSSAGVVKEGILIAVECVDCGARGPCDNTTEADAVAAWNRWSVPA
jgi:hypothetical protein